MLNEQIAPSCQGLVQSCAKRPLFRPPLCVPPRLRAMSVRNLNQNAESLGPKAALYMNVHAAAGLQDVMKSNLGPRGTIKMLVSGSGDIKLTKVRMC